MAGVLAISLVGCAQPQTICGTKYDAYGVFNAEENRNPNIRYEVSIGSIVLGILLIETVVVPVVAWGWYLYEPVGIKGQQGVIAPTKCDVKEK